MCWWPCIPPVAADIPCSVPLAGEEGGGGGAGTRVTNPAFLTSVLQSLPAAQREVAGRLVSANLQALLCKQMRPEGVGLVSAPAHSLMEGEGLVAPAQYQMEVASISVLMQYMESLLENFTPGEMGLLMQLPLGIYARGNTSSNGQSNLVWVVLDYCAEVFHSCIRLEHK